MRRKPVCAAPLLRARARQRPRLSWLQALILVAAVTTGAVLVSATLVTMTDPGSYPDLITALWWSVTTVTTVGYGDVVPASPAGRLVGAMLMFVGIGSFALLTAVAASAIVIGEVGDEERRIEREEEDIRRGVAAILARLESMDERLRRLEDRLEETGRFAGEPAGSVGPGGATS